MSELSASNERVLRVLLAVHEVALGRTRENVAVSDVERHLAGDSAIDPDDLRDLLTQLMDRGLLSGFPSLGGLNTGFLEPEGKEVALRFRDLREDPVARARQLQDDYLRWLYAEVEQNVSCRPAERSPI